MDTLFLATSHCQNNHLTVPIALVDHSCISAQSSHPWLFRYRSQTSHRNQLTHTAETELGHTAGETISM